jgi:Leucine-rich repeat (LRR) protein
MAEDWQPLTHAILKESLKDIELIVGGGGFAFTKLDCTNKELTDLGNKVHAYKQLKHIVLSQNKIEDLAAVMQLPHLLTLTADENQVNKLDCVETAELPWCQRLDLSKNKLVRLPSLIPFQRLRSANFAENLIESLEGFGDHPVLEFLDLQGNQLASLVGMGCLHNLKELVLESNQLTSLEGLNAHRLVKLSLGSNPLESLQFIAGVPACSELDLKDCKLSGEDIQMPELRRLADDTPSLKKIILEGNPLKAEFGENPKAEVLARVPQVQVVEDEEVTDDDREASLVRVEELVVLKEEADKAAREAREEEERLAAEAAAAEAEAAAAGEGAG